MVAQLSKKSVRKTISHILILIIEKDIKKFSVNDLWTIEAKYGLYDKWEQKRTIQVLQQLGILKNVGGDFESSIKSTDAIKLLNEYTKEDD